MISTQTANRISREIYSIEVSGNPSLPIMVSASKDGQALWGEVMALPYDDMEAAITDAGYDPERALEEMMTAEEFNDYYEID